MVPATLDGGRKRLDGDLSVQVRSGVPAYTSRAAMTSSKSGAAGVAAGSVSKNDIGWIGVCGHG